jgi:hypothetical protein
MILQVFPHEKLLNNGKTILETKIIYLVIKFELKLLGFLYSIYELKNQTWRGLFINSSGIKLKHIW